VSAGTSAGAGRARHGATHAEGLGR
jgi:hypothetical protein